MRKVHIERLRTLYALIDGIPDERFQLSDWRKHPNSGEVPNEDFVDDCKTLGCALGWACAYPPFQEQKLRFSDRPMYRAGGTAYISFDAGAAFFGIPSAESRALFNASNVDSLDVRIHSLGIKPINDKYRFLSRLGLLLQDKKIISQERFNSLVAAYPKPK